MQILRRVSQVFFIAIFVVLFLYTTYPLENAMPADIFLRLDPLTVLSASIASRTVFSKGLIALVLLLLTVVFGRFFCGWICPLGSTLDASDYWMKTKPRNHQKNPLFNLRYLKYAVLVACLTAALFSVQLAGYLDPIPLITRTLNAVIYPFFVLMMNGLVGLLMSFGFLENSAFKIHDLLSGTLLPVSVTAFQGSVLIGWMFVFVLLASHIQKRFWCRNLCPLGGLLGVFSKYRWNRRTVSDDCTSCRRCSVNCRTGAIRPDFKNTDHTECVNCMDCRKICPVQAVHFGFVRSPKPSRVDLSKRRFLGAGLAGIASLGLIKTGFTDLVHKGNVIRPPGALSENAFLDRCVRCGECIRICSTSGKGLQHAGLESGWEGLGTPLLHTPEGYCEYNCNLCGKVCPTGAIPSLFMNDKHRMKMGTAHFDHVRCIPWHYGENCMVCEEHCPVPDKAIRFRKDTVTASDGRKADVLLPYVDETACIGCGICVKCCPLEADKGIFLTNAGEIRTDK